MFLFPGWTVNSVVCCHNPHCSCLQETYTLEHTCGGASASHPNDRMLNLLTNFVLPLCIRVGCGCRGEIFYSVLFSFFLSFFFSFCLLLSFLWMNPILSTVSWSKQEVGGVCMCSDFSASFEGSSTVGQVCWHPVLVILILWLSAPWQWQPEGFSCPSLVQTVLYRQWLDIESRSARC